MSINYRAINFYGWKISEEEFATLDDELKEYLIDTETIIIQNGWIENTDYGFVYANMVIEIDERIIPAFQIKNMGFIEGSDEWLSHESWRLFKLLFPSRADEHPAWYTMIQVY